MKTTIPLHSWAFSGAKGKGVKLQQSVKKLFLIWRVPRILLGRSFSLSVRSDDVPSSFPRENRNWTFNGPTVQFAISAPFAVIASSVRLCNSAAARRPNQPSYGGGGSDLGGHSCFVIRSASCSGLTNSAKTEHNAVPNSTVSSLVTS